jgi:hypothetical protein
MAITPTAARIYTVPPILISNNFSISSSSHKNNYLSKAQGKAKEFRLNRLAIFLKKYLHKKTAHARCTLSLCRLYLPLFFALNFSKMYQPAKIFWFFCRQKFF